MPKVNYARRGHRVEYRTILGDWTYYGKGTKEQCEEELKTLKKRNITCRLIEVREIIVKEYWRNPNKK